MRTATYTYVAAALVLAFGMTSAQAKVSAEEASKLGKELTCIGAEKAGNADGTIPEYTGKWLGTPPGIDYTPHVGQHPVDPYPDDQPLFTITAGNVDQYAERLTVGQKAMFAKYPDTYKIHVYPGRRDFRYPDGSCEAAMKNALEAELTDNGMGFSAVIGSVPFPIPKNGHELLKNHINPFIAFTEISTRDMGSVKSDGSISWGGSTNRNLNMANVPASIGQPVGPFMAYTTNVTSAPERDRGRISLSVEPTNFAKGKRLAWNYDPGTRRVRQLPEYGFDQPMNGTGGRMTIDQDRMFNGSPERFDFEVLGKREIYIPANAYKVNGKDVKYADLLTRGHANPDYIRYELRRVWVLEGTLKEGFRHVFGKRVLYLDEDNYQAIVADNYDTRGNLWQHNISTPYYAFDAQIWYVGSSYYYDLNAGSYVAYNLMQERPIGPILNKGGLDPSMFTPERLRTMGN